MLNTIHIPAPGTPQSDAADSPLEFNPATLALLDDFLASKADEENKFQQLLVDRNAAQVAGLLSEPEDNESERPMLSLDEYRVAFGEDWQLSQFWYSTSFATRLASLIDHLLPAEAAVAFVCSPTAFVAFQHAHPRNQTRLLEYDQRFAVLAPERFVSYDLNEPDNIPKDIKNSFDLAVVDPPYLNEDTNTKVIKTLRQILKPTAKLILITSTSVEDVIHRLYDTAPIGPLRKMPLKVEHGQLANDFACWGSWDGAENFGSY